MHSAVRTTKQSMSLILCFALVLASLMTCLAPAAAARVIEKSAQSHQLTDAQQQHAAQPDADLMTMRAGDESGEVYWTSFGLIAAAVVILVLIGNGQ